LIASQSAPVLTSEPPRRRPVRGGLFVIASNSFVHPELAEELGEMPPSFIPLGGHRLFVHQGRVATSIAERVLLLLPEGFEPCAMDARLLESLGLKVVYVSDELSFGASLLVALGTFGPRDEVVRILRGGALLREVPTGTLDGVLLAPDRRERELPHPGATSAPVASTDLSGVRHAASSGTYFSFSSSSALTECLRTASGSLELALEAYGESVRRLEPLSAPGDSFDLDERRTYFEARSVFLAKRAFNRLEARGSVLTKTSGDAVKMDAEASWYEDLSPALAEFVPAFRGRVRIGGRRGYRLHYEPLVTLSDLFVFGRLTPAAWARVFRACDQFLAAARAAKAKSPLALAPERLYLNKCLERLERFSRESGFDVRRPCRINGARVPSLTEIARLTASIIGPAGPDDIGVSHGDFCFSNILWDGSEERIKVIDPRGLCGAGHKSPYGDVRYDLGKLFHSAVGRYDLVVSGYARAVETAAYSLTLEFPQSPRLQRVAATFLERDFAGYSPRRPTFLAIAVSLFLSMLPLHSDSRERQMTLLAVGLELFKRLDRDGRGGARS
jgi:hypothetical protein